MRRLAPWMVACALAVPAAASAFELCDSAARREEFQRSLEPLRVALKERRFADLDARLNALLAASAAGRMSDAEANRQIRVFEVAQPAHEPMLMDWLRAYPKSEAAHLALAAHYVARGFAARGGDYSNKTSSTQMYAMADNFRKALFVLDQADKVSEKPTLSIAHRITIAAATGDHRKAEAIYHKAIRDYPDTLQVRIRFIWAANPKWGGGLKQLAAIDDDARSLPPADRRYIRYLVLIETGSALLDAPDDKGAFEAYRSSIELCPGFDDGIETAMRIATRTRNFDALWPLTGDYLERYPRAGWAYSTRGWILLEKKDYRGSFDNYQKAVDLGYGPAYEGLAWHYENGKVVPVDYRRAIDLYMTAAAHGVRGAREKADNVRKGAGIQMR